MESLPPTGSKATSWRAASHKFNRKVFDVIHNLPDWQVAPHSLKISKTYLWLDGGVGACLMLIWSGTSARKLSTRQTPTRAPICCLCCMR